MRDDFETWRRGPVHVTQVYTAIVAAAINPNRLIDGTYLHGCHGFTRSNPQGTARDDAEHQAMRLSVASAVRELNRRGFGRKLRRKIAERRIDAPFSYGGNKSSAIDNQIVAELQRAMA